MGERMSKLKIHYGTDEEMSSESGYEYNFFGTACGIDDLEESNYTCDWRKVTCKKCKRLQYSIIAGQKADEEAINNEMGDMAKFFANGVEEEILGLTNCPHCFCMTKTIES